MLKIISCKNLSNRWDPPTNFVYFKDSPTLEIIIRSLYFAFRSQRGIKRRNRNSDKDEINFLWIWNTFTVPWIPFFKWMKMLLLCGRLKNSKTKRKKETQKSNTDMVSNNAKNCFQRNLFPSRRQTSNERAKNASKQNNMDIAKEKKIKQLC